MFAVMGKQRSNGCHLLRTTALVLAIVTVTGCTLMRTASFHGGVCRAGVRFRRTHEQLQTDVPFSSRYEVTLDLYGQPEGSGYPVLIFVHGGGWNSCEKELLAPVAMQLVTRQAGSRPDSSLP